MTYEFNLVGHWFLYCRLLNNDVKYYWISGPEIALRTQIVFDKIKPKNL